jgi:hypothetical protein
MVILMKIFVDAQSWSGNRRLRLLTNAIAVARENSIRGVSMIDACMLYVMLITRGKSSQRCGGIHSRGSTNCQETFPFWLDVLGHHRDSVMAAREGGWCQEA